MSNKILIGGQALAQLGSSRYTNDVDYLTFVEDSNELFITGESGDLVNANGHKFFNEIYEAEKDNEIATPQSLLELKAFAFVQHCLLGHWQKADDAEYDIKFLCRKFNLTNLKVAQKYIQQGPLTEVNKIINSVK